jgi:hypothetical protein
MWGFLRQDPAVAANCNINALKLQSRAAEAIGFYVERGGNLHGDDLCLQRRGDRARGASGKPVK